MWCLLTVLLKCTWFKTNVYSMLKRDPCFRVLFLPLLSVVACACNHDGSNGTTCHQVTGECECLPNVVGLKCDRCAADTYDFGSDFGCTPCNCHSNGAMNQQCNASNGQCECQPGVTGRTCNQCQSGFFGLSSIGCQGTVAWNLDAWSTITWVGNHMIGTLRGY